MEENREIKIVQERNMTFFQELTSNQTLMTGVTGWVVAQVLNGGGAAVRSGKL